MGAWVFSGEMTGVGFGSEGISVGFESFAGGSSRVGFRFEEKEKRFI